MLLQEYCVFDKTSRKTQDLFTIIVHAELFIQLD
jgi:hypothetical protein